MAKGTASQPFDCFSTLIDRHGGPAATFTEQEEYGRTMKATRLSGSHDLSEKLWHRGNHTKSTLKSHVRKGVRPGVRRQLWRERLEISDELVVRYSKALGQPNDAETLSIPRGQFPDLPGLPSFSIQSSYHTAYTRIMFYTGRNNPHASYCPMLAGMAHVLLHFIEEWECYVGLGTLLQRQVWLDRTPAEVQSSIITLCRLTATYLHNIDFSHIKPIGMGVDVFLNKLFTHWHHWPFTNQPFWLLVRVIDLYLVEGPKVFYRLALAAVKLLVTSKFFSSDDPSQWVTQYLTTLSIEQRGEWLASGLAIPRLAWSNILKLWLQHVSDVGHSPASVSIRPPSQKKPSVVTPDTPSEIINASQWSTIWGWLPDWVTSDQPLCLFQASKHGYNLRTIYRKCEKLDPLLLMVKSTGDNIFGAFIVGSLTERHDNQFFGSGESFLFSLQPEAQCYRWTAESDLILRANDEELIVGSGGGAFGLWLDGELDRGSTATCAAFNNAPLTGNREVDFKSAAVEVYYCSNN